MSNAEVIAVARQARREVDTARARPLARLGKACAHLHSQGFTWEQIGAEMGVNLTTAYRWARPYLPD